MPRQQGIHSTNHGFRRDSTHRKARLERDKISDRFRCFALQNECRTLPRSPVERIGWTEQDHLRCMCRRRDMRLLVLRCSTCQNEIQMIVAAEPFDYLRPSPGVPKLFLARGTGMQNNVWF